MFKVLIQCAKEHIQKPFLLYTIQILPVHKTISILWYELQ